ncbi:MAG: PA domain-containing protein, partial [Longimicrobiales bacterium]
MGGPSGERMLEYHRPLTAEPHHAGTPANERAGEYIADRLREFGFDSVQMNRYEVLLPRPTERTVRLVHPEAYDLQLAEPPLQGDPDTALEGVLPPFNAFSADGDVTGEVVYVNYGMPADYVVLDSLGVSVEGKIVLARYGKGWRGIKPRLAAERGAIGALIYSDPAEDGFTRGPVFPDGKWRPEHGVHMGSVLDMPTYPGDPQTPGRPSLPGAERIP